MPKMKHAYLGTPIYFRHFCSLSAFSLIVLVLQSSFQVVLTHYSMESTQHDQTYYASVLILHQEIVKLLMCLVVVAVYDFRQALFPKALPSSGRTSDSGGVHPVPVFTRKDRKMDTAWSQMHGKSSTGLNRLSPTDAIEIHAGNFENENVEAEVFITDMEDKNCNRKEDTTDRIEQNLKLDSVCPVNHSREHHKRPKWATCFKRFVWVYFRCLYSVVFTRDTLKLLLPAVLFTGQNLLIFVGLRYLDPVSFQIWSQVKLLSAALFSVWMLNRSLSWVQWGSLGLLIVGILFTRLKGLSYLTFSVTVSKADHTPRLWEDTFEDKVTIYGNLLGIGSCLISGISSSYAGVYFEKVVKTTKATLAVRNLQLSIFAIPLTIFSILVLEVLLNWSRQQACGQSVQWNIFRDCKDPAPLLFWNTDRVNGTPCPTKPFYIWQGFDRWLTWCLVFIHALGGMLVAVVMRYADNILKGLATGLAVILSGMMSSVLWGYTPSTGFAIGALLVVISIILFHKFEPKR